MDVDKERVRVLKACMGCKQSRRKCNGETPCEHCIKRGVPCEYDPEPPKKRGPKKGTRAPRATNEPRGKRSSEETEEEAYDSPDVPTLVTAKSKPRAQRKKASLVAEPTDASLDHSDTFNVAAAILNLSQACDPSIVEEKEIWQPPGPIIPNEEELGLLKSFFERANQILPVVDASYFYAALEDAQYYPTPEDDEEEDRLNVVSRNSEVFGFRVCYYTLLCVGAKVTGQYPLAKQYYKLAKAYIGPCFQRPTQHLVSALLLMTMIARALCADTQQAALHAALARYMAEHTEVSPNIMMVARIFDQAHTTYAEGKWPPAASPSGQDPHYRFADLAGFLFHQVMLDFPGVLSESDAARMIALADEGVVLQHEHELMPSFPLDALRSGMSAYLYLKTNHKTLAFAKANECIEKALANKWAKYCFPLVFVIARLLPFLKEFTATIPGDSTIADRTRQLSASASTFVEESPHTQGPCALFSKDGTIAQKPCADKMLMDGESREKPAQPPTSDLVGMIGYVILKSVCPITGKIIERKLNAKRKVGPRPGDSSAFLPSEMLRMSAALAPRASALRPPPPSIIPGLADDSVSVSHSTGGEPQSSKLGLGAFSDPAAIRAASPAASMSALSLDSSVAANYAPLNRLGSFSNHGTLLSGAFAPPAWAQLARTQSLGSYQPTTRGALGEAGGAASNTGLVSPLEHSGTFPSAITARPEDFMTLANQAYGDCIVAEFERAEAERSSDLRGTGPASSTDTDDAASVTSLGLHIPGSAAGMMAGIPLDVSALRTY